MKKLLSWFVLMVCFTLFVILGHLLSMLATYLFDMICTLPIILNIFGMILFIFLTTLVGYKLIIFTLIESSSLSEQIYSRTDGSRYLMLGIISILVGIMGLSNFIFSDNYLISHFLCIGYGIANLHSISNYNSNSRRK